MTPSLEGWPTKAKEAPSPHEVRLAPLDTNPVFQSLGNKFDGPIFEVEVAFIRGAYIWEEKDFNLQSVKLTFLFFFQYKAPISAFFMSRRT